MNVPENVIKELENRGIKLYIGGCGCCDSPWVTIAIDNEKVFDGEDVRLDMLESESEWGGSHVD